MTLREGAEAARCDGCPADLFGDSGAFKQVTNTVLYIVGIIAVIMLIIGGIKYVISGGDSKKVTDAKNTILYAIIGLIIAFLSYANKLSEELDIPIILGGTLRDMKTMNDILNTTSIEFFSLTKPFVAQQDFLLEWKENGEGVSRCKSCNNCYGKKESRCFQFG